MSYIYTLLGIVCGAIFAHAVGITDHDGASWTIVIGAGALLLHRVVVLVRQLSDPEFEPFPDLHNDFLVYYFEACRNPSTSGWAQAAHAAKRWENALSKPAKHTRIPAFRRRRRSP